MSTAARRSGRAMAVEPAWARDLMEGTVRAGGADVVALDDANALLWVGAEDAEDLRPILDEHGDHLHWVQLPSAGVERYADLLDHDRAWTCAKGIYAEPVAEMALALTVASMRCLDRYSRARTWRADGRIGTRLHDARVVVLGGGGIATSLLRLLEPFGCRRAVVRRNPDSTASIPDVEVHGTDDLAAVVAGADVVVLALALTPATRWIVDRDLLEVMGARAHLVNVSRGAHVVTDDLVDALRNGTIAGAGLDVTDPEPLPDGHPLWTLPNCIVTPHVANTPEMALPLLADRITANVRRWVDGRPLLGIVDVDAGY